MPADELAAPVCASPVEERFAGWPTESPLWFGVLVPSSLFSFARSRSLAISLFPFFWAPVCISTGPAGVACVHLILFLPAEFGTVRGDRLRVGFDLICSQDADAHRHCADQQCYWQLVHFFLLILQLGGVIHRLLQRQRNACATRAAVLKRLFVSGNRSARLSTSIQLTPGITTMWSYLPIRGKPNDRVRAAWRRICTGRHRFSTHGPFSAEHTIHGGDRVRLIALDCVAVHLQRDPGATSAPLLRELFTRHVKLHVRNRSTLRHLLRRLGRRARVKTALWPQGQK